jgi:hypothetical protein
MNAVPATALGDAVSWNRSNQPNSADGEGSARPRSRRQRLFSDRRSARDSKLTPAGQMRLLSNMLTSAPSLMDRTEIDAELPASCL